MHIRMAVAACVALGACVAEPEIDGRMAFMNDCAACHGADGRGAGEMGEILLTEPPDLTGLARANGGEFPMVAVMSTIDGYNRGSHFSAAMPQFGEGDLGPTVVVEFEPGVGTPVPTRLLALADYVASIQRE